MTSRRAALIAASALDTPRRGAAGRARRRDGDGNRDVTTRRAGSPEREHGLRTVIIRVDGGALSLKVVGIGRQVVEPD